MAALQNKIPGKRGIDDWAFLVHHRDALRSRPRVQPAGFYAIEFDAPGKRSNRSRSQAQQC
jgi:hypothetical protein